jgi:long-chain acyl-CoA synthetase
MLVGDFLEQSCARFAGKTALVCGAGRYSYQALEASANRMAHCLIDRGLHRRDRVAVYLENCAEAVVAIFGALKAGGMFVPINPQVRPSRLQYILNDCNVRALVTSRRLLSASLDALRQCPDLRLVLISDGAPEGDGWSLPRSCGVQSLHASLPQFPENPPRNACLDIDLASLIYTSGSTGNPKGVMLTHLNIVSAATSIISYLENTALDIILSCLPLSFDYGLYQVLMAFKLGGTLILERSFTYPSKILTLMDQEKVTGFPLVPAMAAILLQLRNLERIRLPRLRYITNTAQALPVKHILRLAEIFPDVRIFSMYGLTECKRVSYLPPAELLRRPASVGKAMPNCETWIVDEQDRPITDAWKPGELVVRGANVMKGYWNLSDETAKRLKPGVYPGEYVLYTGDIFQVDEDGYLYFIGRRDDMIATGGEKVSPREVENVVHELPDVSEAVAIGMEDEILGKVIRLVAVTSPTSQVTANDIIRHCSLKLEHFKVPRQVEIRHAPLPKTSTGKIATREL